MIYIIKIKQKYKDTGEVISEFNFKATSDPSIAEIKTKEIYNLISMIEDMGSLIHGTEMDVVLEEVEEC